ncbi:MAG: hypothetical protein AAFZ65_15895, partial [Planctomycetota bacterium]
MQAAREPTHAAPATPASARTTLGDLWIGLLVAAGAFALFSVLEQPRLYGDGPGLATLLAEGRLDGSHHVGYLPLAEVLRVALAGGDPVRALHLASALPMALATGLLFATVRRLGRDRLESVCAAVAWVTTPGALFFATTGEVHAPHAAALALAMFAATHAPWGRPGLATLIVAPCLACLYWTHVSAPLLGLGLVLLVRATPGARVSTRTLLFGVGPAWVASLLLAMGVASWIRTGSFSVFAVDTELQILGDYAGAAPPFEVLLHNANPYGLLVMAGVWGAGTRLRGWPLLAWLALVLPSWIFFNGWGVKEFGGYLLPTSLALAWSAAAWLRAERAVSQTVGLLVAMAAMQLFTAHLSLADWNHGWDYADRTAVVAQALPEGGTLVVPWVDAPAASIAQPSVVELPIAHEISLGIHSGLPPESMAVASRELERLFADGAVAVDVSFESRAEFHTPSGRL